MPKYIVDIEGRNFLVNIDDVIEKCGFYTSRFIETDNKERAKEISISLIWKELEGRFLNNQSDLPEVLVEEVKEVISFEDNLVPGSGFTWFSEG